MHRVSHAWEWVPRGRGEVHTWGSRGILTSICTPPHGGRAMGFLTWVETPGPRRNLQRGDSGVTWGDMWCHGQPQSWGAVKGGEVALRTSVNN